VNIKIKINQSKTFIMITAQKNCTLALKKEQKAI